MRKKIKEFKPFFDSGIRELEEKASKLVEADYRRWLDKKYPFCKFPICCETCKFVANEFWHCDNQRSFKQHINIDPNDLCLKWEPNQGLFIYLWVRDGRERRKLSQNKDNKQGGKENGK